MDTDLADFGAQAGSVSSSWLVNFANNGLSYFSKSKKSGPRPLGFKVDVYCSYISSCFQQSRCRINSTAALRGILILELMPRSMDWPFFITRGDSDRIPRMFVTVSNLFRI